jgi:hypothetical protein
MTKQSVKRNIPKLMTTFYRKFNKMHRIYPLLISSMRNTHFVTFLLHHYSTTSHIYINTAQQTKLRMTKCTASSPYESVSRVR